MVFGTGGCWVGIGKEVGIDVNLKVRLGYQLGWVCVETGTAVGGVRFVWVGVC